MLFFDDAADLALCRPRAPRMLLVYAMFIIANIIVAFQPLVLAKIINTVQQGGPDALRESAFLGRGLWRR